MNVPDDIGKIYKIRVWHDNTGDSADWLLDKIVFVGEEDEIEFACGQWLSLDKDDEQIIRELPAAHPGEDVPEVLTYNVSVKTSKKVGSGTNANVYITVFGERGDTGVRNLDDHNYLDKLRKFERSNTDHFDVKAVSMGDLTKVIIGHDGAGSGAGWHLDRVKITDPATEKVYYFHCKKWLDEGEDDGLIERELEVDDDGESGDDDE
ncbi:lipoxygenase homology domain-containing protein 1-like [Glandiceps talaboti]